MSTPPKLTPIGSSRDNIAMIGPRPAPVERPQWRARVETSASKPEERDPLKPTEDGPGIKELLAPRAARTTVYAIVGVLGGLCALVLISLLVNSIMEFKLGANDAKTPPANQAAQSTTETKSSGPPTDQDYSAAQKKLADALSRMSAQQQAAAAKPAESQTPATEQPAPAPATAAPAQEQQTAKVESRPPAPTINADDVSRALIRASSLIREGQVASARALLERASQSNDPAIAFALAETYDPKTLARWKTIGLSGDSAKARALYQTALDGGVAEARTRIDALDR
jgi:hypothetical protein